jgi:elongator complex protein 2
VASLPGHTLSVTRVRWSGDDSLLASVSRDRGWIVYDSKTWKTVHVESKAHGRIIWDVAFGERYMVTCSRDKTCKIWGLGTWECVATIKFDEGVTACAVLSEETFAVGLENGGIYLVGKKEGEWGIVNVFEARSVPSEVVLTGGFVLRGG